jgi:hypothetical protein
MGQDQPIDWYSKGCEVCRQAVLSAHPNGVLQPCGVNISAHASLSRCLVCGSYWIENEREAHVIDAAEAARTFGQLPE